MKDSFGNLFRERFHGHEVPVAPGTWQAIQSQLAAGAPAAQEPTPGQLQEKFAGHEVHVDPAVWQNISAQLGHGVAAGTAGGGFFGGMGWAAAGVAGLLIAGGLVYTLNTGSKEPSNVQVSEQVKPAVDAVVQANAPKVNDAGTVAVAPVQASERPAQGSSSNTNRPQKQATAASSTEPNETGKDVGASPETSAPQTGGNTAVATTDNDRPGEDVVNEIIADMTEEVEQAVLANPPSGTPPATSTQAPANPGGSEPEQPVSAPVPDLFLQNVFTPNGDGVNDTYQITSEGFTSTKVRIFSVKSNQLVFSTNTGEPWTGANCEDGYYMVAVEATTPDGRLVSDGKVVWLNRNSTN